MAGIYCATNRYSKCIMKNTRQINRQVSSFGMKAVCVEVSGFLDHSTVVMRMNEVGNNIILCFGIIDPCGNPCIFILPGEGIHVISNLDLVREGGLEIRVTYDWVLRVADI